MIVIWECRLKAALIDKTMSEVTESLRHIGEGNKRDEVHTRPSQETFRETSLQIQMVAEPAEEYGKRG